MKKLLFSALLVLGCNDSMLRNNLPTYLCFWGIPGCSEPETEEKANSILDNGIVSASITCLGHWGSNNFSPRYNLFRIQKIQDGSVLYSFASNPDYSEDIQYQLQVMSLCGLSEPCSKNSFVWPLRSNNLNKATYKINNGRFTMVLSGLDVRSETPPYYNISPQTMIDEDVETACTGFNFDAFSD